MNEKGATVRIDERLFRRLFEVMAKAVVEDPDLRRALIKVDPPGLHDLMDNEPEAIKEALGG